MTGTTSMLLLPGWQNSGPGHWQSHWERLPGFERVEQDDWDWPRRGDWMARLEDVLLGRPGPSVLVAHSLGCHLVAAWAAHTRHRHLVRAALLVAPPHLERPDTPPQVATWVPAVRQPLPFKALLAYGEDDPYSSPQASLALAADWAVPTWSVGQVGHVNADSGLGDWPEGLARLRGLMADAPC